MTLYEIDRQIEDLIDPETGEVADAEEFDRLQMEGVALAYKEYTVQELED